MCCSVLQCAAVYCSVLQYVAVCCSMLQQCVAVCCSVLQYVAVCSSMLQCVPVCCSVLQYVAMCCMHISMYQNNKSFQRVHTCTCNAHTQSTNTYSTVWGRLEWCVSHTRLTHNQLTHMGWLRLVGSLKTYVSFAEEPYKRDHILPQRPIILGSLLIVATPYCNVWIFVCQPTNTYSNVWNVSHIHIMCGMVQHTATHCNTHIPHIHVMCGMLQHTATHCNTLQHTHSTHTRNVRNGATHCNTLQHTHSTHTHNVWNVCTDTYSNACTDSLRALPICMHTEIYGNNTLFSTGLQCVAVCCGVLQSVVVCCMHRSTYQNNTCVYMYTLDLQVRYASLTWNMHRDRYASLTHYVYVWNVCVAVCCSVLQHSTHYVYVWNVCVASLVCAPLHTRYT